MTKWEYHFENNIFWSALKASIDILGLQGWELVTIVDYSSGDLSEKMAVLKRPIN